MAKNGIGPGPKQSKPAAGSRTDSAGMQYFGRQVANAMNAQKPAAAKKPAAKKPAAPAPAPKKAAAPAPAVAAKKPSTINKRAPLMDVNLGKGYKMSIDTTSMNKPDENTYNYMIKNPAGKVTSKGNLARSGGGAGIGKFGASQLVKNYKGKK